MTDDAQPAAGDLEREVRAELTQALKGKRIWTAIDALVPVVVRLIEAHRAPLIEQRTSFSDALVDSEEAVRDALAGVEVKAEPTCNCHYGDGPGGRCGRPLEDGWFFCEPCRNLDCIDLDCIDPQGDGSNGYGGRYPHPNWTPPGLRPW